MPNQARFTVTSLLEGKSAVVEITPVAAERGLTAMPGPDVQGSKGLGFEIASVAALPDAEDYAAHEFYAANFTAAEIAFCANQPSAKAAFQSLLAAKHAIAKAGAANKPPEGFKSVEITFDGEGRPTYPGCLLSVSDTGTIAAALCFWPGGTNWLAAPAGLVRSTRSPGLTFRWRTRVLAFLVLLSLLVLFGLGLWKLLEFWRH